MADGRKTRSQMTKDAVLAILKSTNGPVSGEAMSRQIGVSRMAVSAAVKSLREDGYEIVSATRRGYELLSAPDNLTSGDLMAHLGAGRMESVLCLDKIDSTNRKVRELADLGAPDGQVVIANEQTAGRGRRGRSFLSLKDKGIYFSILLRPSGSAADLTSITAWTAVAVSRAIARVCGLTPGIKWVNDLILDRRKICGILTELALETETGAVSSLIIGIGVNVNQTLDDFPEDLRDVAGSIAMAAGHPVSRAAIAAAMVEEMDRLRLDWPDKPESYLSDYRAASLSTDREVVVISGAGQKKAYALGIGDDFSLKVRYDDGSEEDLRSGEISVRGLEGYV